MLSLRRLDGGQSGRDRYIISGCMVREMEAHTLTLMCVGLGSLRGQEMGLIGWPMTKLLGWTGTCMAAEDVCGRAAGQGSDGGV